MRTTPPFRVRVTVRGYELDTQGHLNQAVYLQYCEHARWQALQAAGISQERLIADGVGPAALENTIRFHRELRGGEEVEVSCAFSWSGGKTFRITQEIRRTEDNALAAELHGVGGLLDLKARRLVADPVARFRALAKDPELLGISAAPERPVRAPIEITEPVTTERLSLRPFTLADEADMLDFESRPEVARYLYNQPRTPENNATELALRTTQSAIRKEGDTLVLAIELPDEGKVIGYTLLTWLSATHLQGEFGYVLHPDYARRGYATEAADAMLRLGFEQLGLHRIIGRCDTRNGASAALMERLGMRREAHLVEAEIFKGEWGSELHYAILATEWRAAHPD